MSKEKYRIDVQIDDLIKYYYHSNKTSVVLRALTSIYGLPHYDEEDSSTRYGGFDGICVLSSGEWEVGKIYKGCWLWDQPNPRFEITKL